jgi:hypothetical protein
LQLEPSKRCGRFRARRRKTAPLSQMRRKLMFQKANIL